MHIMIDIETLGTSHDSAILQIAAVAFNEAGMDEGIVETVSLHDQLSKGRKIEENTVAWWIDSTPIEARKSVLVRDSGSVVSLENALETVNEYIRKNLLNDTINGSKHDRIWAKSPSFDLAILSHAMNQCNIIPAWAYFEEADVRTIVTINRLFNSGINPISNDNAHNALEDARNQALYIAETILTYKDKFNTP